jgi:hypothetical protein
MLSKHDFNVAKKEYRLRKYNPYFSLLEKYIEEKIQSNDAKTVFNFESKRIVNEQSWPNMDQEKVDTLLLQRLVEYLEHLGYTIHSSDWRLEDIKKYKQYLYIYFS